MSKRYLFAVLLVVMVPALALSQGTISGTVTDAGTGDALPGANVIVVGQAFGGASDLSGNFVIEGVPAGNYEVSASVIGYETVTMSAQVAQGVVTTLNFALSSQALEMSALEVLASRLGEEAPVAYTDISKEEMELRLGSRDIPLVLNTAPSVFSTEQGGGAGDARINVRGFNQRNVAIMINGVPVNDMENGWVYWSNWDGVGDATSSIQVQRGMSGVNLAVPSIGGTMNIITSPNALEAGGFLKQEFGSYGFLKTTLSYNSGLIGDRLAFSGAIVRKTGEGYYKGTFTDAWAYYAAASYALSKDNRFELYAVGAPQRHGQNLYKQNAAVYDIDYAKDELGYSDAAIADFEADNASGNSGRDYNQNYGPISDSFKDNDSKQYFQMYGIKDGVERFDPGFIMERENFFHKPQVNLNWYLNLTDKLRLASVVYFSGGSGGGTGTYGSPKWDYSGFSRVLDFEASWEENSSDTNGKDYGGGSNAIDATYHASQKRSDGILRNSVNQQWTLGAVSKLSVDLSDALKLQFGIDYRTAEIGHWREVRDLMGGDYYVYTGNDFDTDNASQMKTLGDKIAYHNTNTINWLGVYGQGAFEAGRISGFGVAGLSTVGYTYIDHFREAVAGEESTDDGEFYAENKGISGIQVKGGLRFALTSDMGVFGNFGLINKVPNFDGAIRDFDGAVFEDPELEKFNSFEGGLDASLLNGMVAANVGYYMTSWKDRSVTRGITNQDGSDGFVYITGLDASHSGFEAEIGVKPMDMLRLDAALSFGDWHYTNDVAANYQTFSPDSNGVFNAEDKEYNLYLKDLKVGDQPQTAMVFTASLFPLKGLTLQAVYKMYDGLYSDWDPLDRDDETDRTQSWQVPAYSILDFHFKYDLPMMLGPMRAQLVGHVYNALDATYIQEAVDNSSFSAYTADGKDHSANDAEVFMGLPMRFNVGLNLSF